MFRDREEGDCKGNSYNPAYQGLVTRVWGKHALASIQNPPVNIIYLFFLRVRVPDIKPCSHYTTFRVSDALGPSHYTTDCDRESWVFTLQDSSATGAFTLRDLGEGKSQTPPKIV